MNFIKKAATTGIIGGSGIYRMAGMDGGGWTRLRSSFGEPSDQAFEGTVGNARALFLPRHGRGHHLPPSAVNYRANIEGLKVAGCQNVLAVLS